MNKTEYRSIHDGTKQWLQYKTVKRISFFFFFKISITRWEFVRSKRHDIVDDGWRTWDKKYGSEYFPRTSFGYITDAMDSLQCFVQDNPDIQVWEAKINKQIARGRREWDQKEKKKALKRGSITNLNT